MGQHDIFDRTASFEALPAAEVCRAMGSGPDGLGTPEAAARLARFGPNTIAVARNASLPLKFLANFTHLMAMLLWIAGFVAIFARMPQLAFSIWAVNVINGAFSFWQEYKAEKATEAMRRMLDEKASVVRGGEILLVDAVTLVPGDVLVLAEGCRVCADARLIESADLRLDQSTLTGESRSVLKTHGAVAGRGMSRLETPNVAFAGTSVVSGTGRGVVFATGMDTEFGKIAGFTQGIAEELCPLQKEMRRVTRVVTVIAVCSGCVFFLLSVLLAGMDWAEGLVFGMGMIVAFVPEGLLPTVTLSLAMGVQRMAGRNALVKRLSAVETLGCASVICTDKTGTLTQNEMTVREIWLPGVPEGDALRVTGTGYAPDGGMWRGDEAVEVPRGGGLHALLLSAGLCTNARLQPPGEGSSRWTVIGDPTEAALRVAALKAGVDLAVEERATPRLRELPFDSRRRRMSTVHRGDGETLVHAKGAPREVLELCTRMLAGGDERPLDEPARARIMGAGDGFARSGLRVLAVARRTVRGEGLACADLGRLPAGDVEADMTFLGLVAMMDPPRPEVEEAVATCRRAGIRIVMITGDYGLTAESVARRIGIIRDGRDGRDGRARIVSGADLDGMDEAALDDALSGEVIFARAAPEHKLRIVSALQRAGHVVAVTGDGVNDAPAIKKADIGIAMGLSGTDVAKEAADVILTDDNFATIVGAIEEGRAVFANIKKFTTYIFTSNTPEAVPFILFALSGGRIPLALNVMHILAVDLGTDLLPALGLGAEKAEAGLMDRPPRNLREHVITPGLLARAYLFLGPLQSLAVMAAFYFLYWTNGHWGQWLDLPSAGPLYESATAMALACVVTTQIGNLFAQRTERASSLRVPAFGNRLLWLGVASELAVVAAIVHWPPAQRLVGTGPFPLFNWLFLFAWTPLLLLADEARKWVQRRIEKTKHTGVVT
ncbi:cation-translocating P-type ATPase [Desulfomicrobium escambiense]|uniref:cation-translocating P-type ATPase n=1 Tax=Desulfomicrobium escambiense TaxID=29503 RepID=UPI000416BEA4|nr:cation-transporting P-type ATPase [Desulfomicrobium escambiense]